MAVYTEVPDDDLAQFIAEYDAGTLLSCKGIAEGVENSNFLLHTTGGYFILTLYEKRVNPADLPFFLGLMQHLAARGISCPLPVQRRDGALLGQLCGRPAAMVTFLEGMSVKKPFATQCGMVGEGLARMHGAGEGFGLGRANALSLDGWRGLVQGLGEKANKFYLGLAGVLNKELDELDGAWPLDLPRGIIHADLFPDNVFFLQNGLSGFIDFYFACTDMLAYDLAICLNAWCFEPDGAYNATKGRALIAGYHRVRPLSAAEQAALPLLARGAALRFLLTRLVDWFSVPEGALVRPKDPMEYLRKLRFHQGIADISAYGWSA